MKYIKQIGLGVLALAMASSCKPELETPSASAGDSLKLARYVAIGNSLTAGFADGGLYLAGQQSSYPNILAGQFKLAGGGEFEQPLFPIAKKKGSGYLSFTGYQNGGPVLTPTAPTDPELAVRGIGANGTTPLYTKYETASPQATVQNLGIPGIRLSNLWQPFYGFNNPLGFNPYFERILTSTNATTNYAQYIATSNPTFFTCWMGNNDVLGFATNGGDLNKDQSTDFVAITSPATFDTLYKSTLRIMSKNKTVRGAVANIPFVTSVPFFSTVTYKSVRNSSPAVKNAKIWIRTSDGQTRELKQEFVNSDSVMLKTNESDLILLTTRAVLGRPDNITISPGNTVVIPHGFSQFNPLTNWEVLDKDEVSATRTAVLAYNSLISKHAADYKLASVDVNNYIENTLRPGTAQDGIGLSTAFVSGGVISLDGIHLTPRGNALVANEFIKAINIRFNAAIPTVNINKYPGVIFPDKL